KKELIYLLRISSIIINKKLLTLNNMSEFLAFANKNEMDHLIKGLLSMNLERIHDHGGLPENFLLIYLIKNYISEY
ncbi:hypothetical protein KJ940_02985, partial [Myxococcota bacterium]|nr:hypothetical protein [Myxococcota bacterium]